MGNYQGYQKYQDSGVKWLGEIPEHWEQKRFKFSVNLINNKIEAENSNLSYMGLEHIESWTGKKIEDKNASSEGIGSHFLPNDVLFGKLRPYLAKVYLSDIEGLASTEALVLRCKNNIFPKFLKYYILSRDFINIVDSSTFGAKMPRASWDFIGNLFFIFPPLNEQEKIAQFLDYKTKQIDELIKKKETLIEKLDEKRTAIISHAVTKGLDSSVPIKDSGIEWLGDIPKHWKVIRLKHLANKITDGEHISPKNIDIGIPLLSAKDIRERYIRFDDASYVTEEDAQVFWKRCKPEKGDILIVSRGATVGRIGFVEINTKFCLMGSVILIKLNDIVYPDFIYFATNQNYVQKSIIQVSDASAQQAIYLIDVKETKFFIPPYNEQKQISKHLDQKTAQIDQQKAKIKQAIELLKEYRTSLITNAVTGKIDVSQIAIPSPQKPQPQKG
ncbi:MAG: restriction endonuclease subunit S [Anabaena sp. CoA2_C59]|jgi:type I restriction enzyme S subunit|nr:restriction endonuclease subunit S [Anabaena sp. CoA2_C59]